jgi:glucose/arabinose dehydrogenase
VSREKRSISPLMHCGAEFRMARMRAQKVGRGHGWIFIRFGPDGYLYVSVGAPCNIYKSGDERFASPTSG